MQATAQREASARTPEQNLAENFHILQFWNPARARWGAWELVTGSPLNRVRQGLSGRWTKSDGKFEDDMAVAFYNAANGSKAFVMQLPYGITRDGAVRVMKAQ